MNVNENGIAWMIAGGLIPGGLIPASDLIARRRGRDAGAGRPSDVGAPISPSA